MAYLLVRTVDREAFGSEEGLAASGKVLVEEEMLRVYHNELCGALGRYGKDVGYGWEEFEVDYLIAGLDFLRFRAGWGLKT